MARTSATTKNTKTKKTDTKNAPSKATKAKPNTKAKRKMLEETPPPEPIQPIRRELTGVAFIMLALFTIISCFNTDGIFIRQFAAIMKGLLGYGFFVLIFAFFLTGYIYIDHKGKPVTFRATASLLIPLVCASIMHILFYTYPADTSDLKIITGMMFESGQLLKSGGALGGLFAYFLESVLSVYGAILALLVLLMALFMLAFHKTIGDLIEKFRSRAKYNPEAYKKPQRAAMTSVDLPIIDDEYSFKASAEDYKPARARRAVDLPLGDELEPVHLYTEQAKKAAKPQREARPSKESLKREAPKTMPTDGVEPMTAEDAAAFAGVVDVIMQKTADEAEMKKAEEEMVAKAHALKLELQKRQKTNLNPPEKKQPRARKISRDEIEAEAEAVASKIESTVEEGDYKFPPVSLLRSSKNVAGDARDEIRLNRERLETALHSFGINARISGVIHGPTVTRYDIELEQGVKIARITNLSGDLALALGVVNVRIAPIPDKISTMGIEVPNKNVSTVYLRDIIDSPKFSSAKSKISFAIGKDISGEGVIGNIAKLPHLLIAGTTGSGKSVCMNSLILSLLYKAKPDEVKLIMIDPKMVELGIYNGIPHLYVPVVTDPKKAAGALQWSVVEMLKRYRLFADAGVRDLEHYNMYCRETGEQTMPQVVIVIDELADLMLVASKDVEESICRVAQMGRAAGMHLVIATQRPSADVITGLMKANIPSRIAFAVSSAMESRIILDQGGADKLIGMGDMLFAPVGSGKPTRIQGAFVSDEEREDVINFIKQHSSTSETNNELVDFMNNTKDKDSKDSKEETSGSMASEYDEMLPQAVEVVIEMKACSVSMLQRRVKLGYSRAARIVDQMEELGVVGPYEGAKPRQVLVDLNGWREIQRSLGMIADDDMDEIGAYNEEDFGEEF